jgi:putative membrane protein
LIIPIVFFMLPHKPLGVTEISTNNGNNFYQSSASVNSAASADKNANETIDSDSEETTASDSEETTASDSDAQASDQQESTMEETDSGLSGLDSVNKTITVDNDEFYQWLVEIFENMDKYEGYSITITGFVFKDSQYFAKNEFSPARLCMTCCTADLSPLGLRCKYKNASSLKKDSWVTVEGVIHKEKYQGEDEPQIYVKKISPAHEVKDYIYPY